MIWFFARFSHVNGRYPASQNNGNDCVPLHLERATMVTKHLSLLEGTKDFHSRLLWMYNNSHYRSVVRLTFRGLGGFFKESIPSSQPRPQDLSFRNNNNNIII